MLLTLLRIIVITYLIRKDTSQVVHCCYSNSCLMFRRKAFHHIFHGQYVFLRGRRLSHEGGRIWRETECIHLREVNGCVLTWAGEDNDGEQVDELVSGCDRGRDAMVAFTFSDWIAVVVEIKNPRLKLCVLKIARKWTCIIKRPTTRRCLQNGAYFTKSEVFSIPINTLYVFHGSSLKQWVLGFFV